MKRAHRVAAGDPDPTGDTWPIFGTLTAAFFLIVFRALRIGVDYSPR